VGEGCRLPIDHLIISFVVDELQHEATAVSGVEAEVAIAFALERRSARG
jgi:hypothetical protein